MLKVPSKKAFLGGLAAAALMLPGITLATSGITLTNDSPFLGGTARINLVLNANLEPDGVDRVSGRILYRGGSDLVVFEPALTVATDNANPALDWFFETGPTANDNGTPGVPGDDFIEFTLRRTAVNGVIPGFNGEVIAQFAFNAVNGIGNQPLIWSMPSLEQWDGVSDPMTPAYNPVTIAPPPVNGLIVVNFPTCSFTADIHGLGGAGTPALGGDTAITAPAGGGISDPFVITAPAGCAPLVTLDAAGLNVEANGQTLPTRYPFSPVLPGASVCAPASPTAIWLRAVDPGVDPALPMGSFVRGGMSGGNAINLVELTWPPVAAFENAIGGISADVMAMNMTTIQLQVDPNNSPDDRFAFIRIGQELVPPTGMLGNMMGMGGVSAADEVVMITQAGCDFDTMPAIPAGSDVLTFDCTGAVAMGTNAFMFGAGLDATCSWSITSIPDGFTVTIDDADDMPADGMFTSASMFPITYQGPAMITITANGANMADELLAANIEFGWYPDPLNPGTFCATDSISVCQQNGCDLTNYVEADSMGNPTGVNLDPDLAGDDIELTVPDAQTVFMLIDFNSATCADMGDFTLTPVDAWITNPQAVMAIDADTWLISVDVAANVGGARTGTLQVRFPDTCVPGTFCNMPDLEITQPCGCTVTVTPDTSVVFPTGGGMGTFDVTDSGAGCSYTVQPGAPFITITDVGGMAWVMGNLYGGAGGTITVSYTVAPNALETPRCEPIDVAVGGMGCMATDSHLVLQEGNCSPTVSPTAIVVPPTHSTGTFDITTAPPPAQQFFERASAPGIAILDSTVLGVAGSPAIDSIIIDPNAMMPDPNGLILDLTVDLDITHPFVSDLKVSLFHHESGTIVELIDRIGALDVSSPTTCDDNDPIVHLSDDAPTSIEDACSGADMQITGTFRPVTPLARFDNLTMAGTWSIIVTDHAPLDTGTLNSWELNFDYQPLGCAWELVGPALDPLGLPLNGNGIPSWIHIIDPPANVLGRYVGTGSQQITYTIDPSPDQNLRTVDLSVIPFAGVIDPACAAALAANSASVTFTQWADCLYTLDPEARTVGAGLTMGNTFTIQTNIEDPLNGCTWRFDDIPSWVTVTRVDLLDYPANPDMGVFDPNTPLNPVLFGDATTFMVPGDLTVYAYPATADNFQAEGTSLVTYDVADNTGNPARTSSIEVGTEAGLLEHTVTQVSGCVFTIVNSQETYTAPAGAGSFMLTTACGWSLSETAPWLELTSAPAGVGSTMVTYEFSANLGPRRRTFINVFNEVGGFAGSHEVIQNPGCELRIDTFNSQFPSAGGVDSFGVLIGDGCVWTSAVDIDPMTAMPYSWINITIGTSGSRDGFVAYTVGANVGPARQGSITVTYVNPLDPMDVQTRTHIIQQASGCVLVGDVLTYDVVAAGASLTHNLFVPPNVNPCAWSAESNDPWITITAGDTGNVPGQIDFDVSANTGEARTGTITVTGDTNTYTITVNQATGCVAVANPAASGVYGPIGGSGSFLVDFNDGLFGEEATCEWRVLSSPDWVTITGDGQGVGTDPVNYFVEQNEGAARNGNIVVEVLSTGATITHMVNQATCVLNPPAPASGSFLHQGGTSNFLVSFAAGGSTSCDWTLSVDQPWVTILSGTTNVGNGIVVYSVAPFFGPGTRNATITITAANGTFVTYAIDQIDDCNVSLNSNASAFDHDGSSSNFQVLFAAGGTNDCPWVVTVSDPWINVQSGIDGVGNGLVTFEVGPYYNDTTAPRERVGTITITLPNGDVEVHTVTQTDNCAPVATATTASYNHSTQAGSFAISGMEQGCPWTLSITDNNWVSIQSAQNGFGNGLVTYEIAEFFTAPAPGTTRSATITVTGDNGLTATHVITQAADCDVSLSSAASTFNHDGGSGNFQVLFAAGGTVDCPWIVSVSDPWINVQSGIDGLGNGIVTFEVGPYYNDTTAPRERVGTITITLDNGDVAVHTITQTDNCAPVVPAGETTATYNHSAQPGFFSLTGLEQGCPWSITVSYAPPSDPEWVSIQEVATGAGNGTIHYEIAAFFVAPALNATRSATITVTGDNGLTATHVITQIADCDVSISDAAETFDHDGGSSNFLVTFAAGGTVDCPWQVSISEPWINVQSGIDGLGNGVVTYEVDSFFDDTTAPRTRTGTITITLPNGDSAVHTVTQTDLCNPTVLPAGTTYGHTTAAGEFAITGLEAGCPWTISIEPASTPWLSIQTALNGFGNGIVTYEVADYFDDPLPATPRTATITVTLDNGLTDTHVITQNADCDLLTLVPAALSFNQPGGSGNFQVPMATGGTVDCPWRVEVIYNPANPVPNPGNQNWVEVTSGINGIGNGIVAYNVAPFFNSTVTPPPPPVRTAIIRITLDNGDTQDHTITQTDRCNHTLNPVTTTASSVGGFYSFDVDFGADPNGALDCRWIARVEYGTTTCPPVSFDPGCGATVGPLYCNDLVDDLDPNWVNIVEGSTEGSGNGLVTFDVKPLPGAGCTRTAFIDVLLDNGLTRRHTITQGNDCTLVIDTAPLPLGQPYVFDNNGRLTGPVFEDDEDNTGTACFVVAFVGSDCSETRWTARVTAGQTWINIVEGANGAGLGTVCFEVDPNIVEGADVGRAGCIRIAADNGQCYNIAITQTAGFHVLDDEDLGDPNLGAPVGFGFGRDHNVVVGYTNLDNDPLNIPAITIGGNTSDVFVGGDAKTGRALVADPELGTDAKGNVVGIFVVNVVDDSGTVPVTLATYDLPAKGRMKYSRRSVAAINTPDGNYSGAISVLWKNTASITATAKGSAKVTVKGNESYSGTYGTTPPGFASNFNITARDGSTNSKTKGSALISNWVPSTASLAVSRNSVKPLDASLKRWTSDLLLLASPYDPDPGVLGQSGPGAAKWSFLFQRQDNVGSNRSQIGKYAVSGKLGSPFNNSFSSKGRQLIGFEQASDEGFLLSKFRRGTTMFPDQVRFSNVQVRIQHRNIWNENLLFVD